MFILLLPHYIMKLAESWQQKCELFSEDLSGESIIVDSYWIFVILINLIFYIAHIQTGGFQLQDCLPLSEQDWP